MQPLSFLFFLSTRGQCFSCNLFFFCSSGVFNPFLSFYGRHLKILDSRWVSWCEMDRPSLKWLFFCIIQQNWLYPRGLGGRHRRTFLSVIIYQLPETADKLLPQHAACGLHCRGVWNVVLNLRSKQTGVPIGGGTQDVLVTTRQVSVCVKMSVKTLKTKQDKCFSTADEVKTLD